MNIDKMRIAKIKKLIDKEFIFNNKITTIQKIIYDYDLIKLTEEIKIESDKRINYEYIKLKNPKRVYTMWFDFNSSFIGIDIPKLVYDFLRQFDFPIKKSTNIFIKI